ncbi:retrovirus-related pol polyprotein from transposon TNT 1-94 [Tanacetum coccineum]|uniref:Retrovirus-related pol polyprotein from transposon TNT 1-94 n=1 Tax=Tanacetum coccineum TaxID=301880 RepID=A0ABQ5CES2_9ASTR
MSRTIPPIPPPLGTKSGNIGSPNRVVIKCKTAKAIWNDLILAHDGPSDTRDTKIAALRLKFNAFKALDDVEEDLRSSSEFNADLNAKYHERALLDEEFVSSEDEGTTKIKAFMAIAKDEPSVRKADARSGQWVKITMKKVHRLLFMTDGDERKHVLDYTHVDLHYVDDQRKNLVNKFNTCSKVTLDQLLSEQVPRNIVKALGGRGRKKEKNSSKEVVFTKVDESSSMPAHEITSNFEFECDTQEHLPPLPKLIGAEPTSTSNNLISLADLTSDIAELTLNTFVSKKKKQTFDKVSHAYVIKKRTKHKSLAIPKSCSDQKANSSTEKLLLTLMEGVKGLKKQIEIPSSTSSSNSQSRLAKKESGPKVVFGDNSSGDTEGYGLVNCNGITFTRVAYVNGLKHNNHKLEEFCDEKGTSQKFSSPCTPEQNGVAERRNRTMIEAARTISIIVKRHEKTAYDVFRGRFPYNSYFYLFVCPVHIYNHRDHLRKFNEKADDGFFLGYSLVAKAFRVFNIRRQEIEETYHVTFSEDDEEISQSSIEGDAINFNETRSFPDDEFLKPRSKVIVKA